METLHVKICGTHLKQYQRQLYTFDYVYLKIRNAEKNQLSQGSIKIAQNKSKEIKKERNNKNINQDRTTTKSRNDDKIKVVSLLKNEMFWYFPNNNGCFLMEDLR